MDTLSELLSSRELKEFIDLAEDLSLVTNVSDFTFLVTQRVRKLIPHEISICGFVENQTYEVSNVINMDYPDSFLREVLHKKKSGIVVESPLVKNWSHNSMVINVEDSLLYNPRYRVWTEAARKNSIRNMIVNGVKDELRGRFSYFNFSNHLVDLEAKHKRILLMLTPHLHFAILKLESISNKSQCNLLSKRETEVLTLMYRGLKNSDIATLLSISLHTVKNHNRKIFEKLKSDNRAQALHCAKKQKILI